MTLDKLIELAKAASKEPWEIGRAGFDGKGDIESVGPIRAVDYFLEDDEGTHNENITFVAAFSPPVMIPLLEELRFLREKEREQ